jgi:hypothetical protein
MGMVLSARMRCMAESRSRMLIGRAVVSSYKKPRADWPGGVCCALSRKADSIAAIESLSKSRAAKPHRSEPAARKRAWLIAMACAGEFLADGPDIAVIDDGIGVGAAKRHKREGAEECRRSRIAIVA